jgi:hypothetical protein
MRNQQPAGKTTLVGYVTPTDSFVVDTNTGEASPTCIFLAVLSSSGYTHAELALRRNVDEWILGHINALRAFGGITKQLICCSGVPNLSRHIRYRDFARKNCTRIEEMKAASDFYHAGKTVFAFGLTERWLSSILKYKVFMGIGEFKRSLQELIVDLNSRGFKQTADSRSTLFEEIERTTLKPWANVTADGETWFEKTPTGTHVAIDQHYYSIPPVVIGQHVDVKVTPDFVEMFFQGKQVTKHPRKNQPGRSSTKPEHEQEQQVSQWSPGRILSWAKKIGPATTYLCSTILDHANQSSAGIRSCLGLLSLEPLYGHERLECACRQAASRKSWTVSSISSMLKSGQDQVSVQLSIPNLELRSKQRKPEHPHK